MEFARYKRKDGERRVDFNLIFQTFVFSLTHELQVSQLHIPLKMDTFKSPTVHTHKHKYITRMIQDTEAVAILESRCSMLRKRNRKNKRTCALLQTLNVHLTVLH